MLRQIAHPATVIALAALFLGGTGGALAARAGLIGSAQIRDHSIRLADLSPTTIAELRGRDGATGPPGPAGLVDPAKLRVIVSSPVQVGSYQVGDATATCPSGAFAISGGGLAGIDGLASSDPEGAPPSSWHVATATVSGAATTLYAIVVCVIR